VTAYKYKTKPRGFQVRALKKMLKPKRGLRSGGGLWMPMRSGKTKVAIDYACVLHQKYGVQRILVLTHSVTTPGVWRKEWEKHCPFDYILKTTAMPNFPKEAPLQVLVLNIQRVYDREFIYKAKVVDGRKVRVKTRSWVPGPNRELYRWRPEVVIIDEATCVGDPSAVQTAHTYRLTRDLNVRDILELTGTPVHRKIWGVFGQFKILDDSVFGNSITAYKDEYGRWGGYMKKKLLKLVGMKKWRRKVEPYVFQLFRVPYRKPIEQVIPVELTEATRRLHDKMEKESIVTFTRNSVRRQVTAPIPLTRALKCAQIAAGFVRDDTGTWHVVVTELRDTFASTVQDLADSEVKRLVVFARHIPELRAATLALKSAGYRTLLLHGSVPPEKREQRIAAFHDPGGYKAFVSQVGTGSMGIDLSAADTCLYYTLPTSILHKDQADARIRLHGDKRPLTYYYFIPEGTYLEVMLQSLKDNMDLADYVANHPTLIHHKERG
jgi:hypothetical protein